jgi:hypothetical protein
VPPPPIGVAGLGVPPLLPMPGEGGVIGLAGAGCGDGIAGLDGAGAAGFAMTGLAATAGFLAGALRAAVLRAAGFRALLLATLRVDFLALALRAGFLAAVFLRALVFLALAPRRALALLREVFFLLVVRFFPLVLVAMASAPILLCCRTRPLKRRVPARITLPLIQACRPT